ncbi:MAG: NitT/TauT family transport system substrate-binding protein [Acidobacteriota bacterium]|nr:NitT/TauT family transport system substrate-binding protein [Acidobacteriota bacterium]
MERRLIGRNRSSGSVVASLAVLAVLATACGGGASPEAKATGPVHLNVAGAPIVPRAGIDIAIDRGYFAEEDLEIKLVEIQSGPEQMPLLASGQVDATITGPASTQFNALAAGIPVKYVAPCGSSSADGTVPNLILNVRQELFDKGQVKSVKDLRGLKLGLSNTESKAYVDAVALLKSGGLSIDDVEVVAPLTFPEQAAGLASGAIDAGLTIEPFATLSAEKKEAVVIGGDNDIMPLRLGCALMYGARLINDKALGDRFMRAYLRGVRDYNDAIFHDKGKAEMVEMMTSLYPVKDAAMYDKMLPNYIDPDGQMNPESLELDLSVYVEKGHMKPGAKLGDILNTTYVEDAVQKLGPYKAP